MALSFSIIFVLFILPIVLGVFFLFRVKKIGIILLCIPVVITIVITGWWVYELNHHFASSTDLSGENIDDVELYDSLTDILKNKYGDYETRDTIYYETLLEFDSILIGADEADDIIYMRTEDAQKLTKQGISVGDELGALYAAYGDNYYHYTEMGRDESINYVDRDLRLHFQFWYQNERIVQIILTEM